MTPRDRPPRRTGRGVAVALALVALPLPAGAAPGPGPGDHRPAQVAECPPACLDGYRLAAGDGGVFAFGDAPFLGSAAALGLRRPIVDLVETPAGQGYWLAAADGGVFAFGDARFRGSLGAVPNQAIVAMAATPTGAGYWLVGGDGGVFAFGDAPFLGSAAAFGLRSPVVDVGATRTGLGYWLLAADGGVFAFGDAPFLGSAAGLRLTQAAVGLAPSHTVRTGYWIASANGGVLPFGGAPDYGSLTGRPPAAPIVGIAAGTEPGGFRLVGADGGVFSFGDAGFLGSLAGALQRPVTAIASKGPRGESVAPGTYLERSDAGGGAEFHNGIFAGFLGPPDETEAPPVVGPRPARRVAFTVAGAGPPAAGEDPRMEATLRNTSGVPIAFPGGLRVQFDVEPPTGQPVVLVTDAPEIRGLGPGETAKVRMPLLYLGDGPYRFTARTTIVLP